MKHRDRRENALTRQEREKERKEPPSQQKQAGSEKERLRPHTTLRVTGKGRDGVANHCALFLYSCCRKADR